MTTADDGIAIFTNIPVGSYDFTYSSGPFNTATRTYSVSEAEIGTTIEKSLTLRSQRGGAMVTVKDPSGKVIVGATVSVTIYGRTTSEITESALGLAIFDNIPAGQHTFTATKAGYTSGTINLQPYNGGTDAGTIVLRPI